MAIGYCRGTISIAGGPEETDSLNSAASEGWGGDGVVRRAVADSAGLILWEASVLGRLLRPQYGPRSRFVHSFIVMSARATWRT